MKHAKTILLLIAVGLFLFAINQQPKQAVADIEGKACTVDDDCPCWGTVMINSTNTTNYGIGKASCNEGACDTSYCVDVEPVGQWAANNPLHYLKTNLGFTIVLIGLIAVAIFLPKQ